MTEDTLTDAQIDHHRKFLRDAAEGPSNSFIPRESAREIADGLDELAANRAAAKKKAEAEAAKQKEDDKDT